VIEQVATSMQPLHRLTNTPRTYTEVDADSTWAVDDQYLIAGLYGARFSPWILLC
jgi:hypothetical protein